MSKYRKAVIFCVFVCIAMLTGCSFLSIFKPSSTYSEKEMETTRTDTIFSANTSTVLSVLKTVLLDKGFEVENEFQNSILTFPMEVKKDSFEEYAIQKVIGGYEPISRNEVYGVSFIKLLFSTSSDNNKTRLIITPFFEAYRKKFVYRSKSRTPPDLFTKGYQEFKGEEIKCKTTGKLEKTIFSCIAKILFEYRKKRVLNLE